MSITTYFHSGLDNETITSDYLTTCLPRIDRGFLLFYKFVMSEPSCETRTRRMAQVAAGTGLDYSEWIIVNRYRDRPLNGLHCLRHAYISSKGKAMPVKQYRCVADTLAIRTQP